MSNLSKETIERIQADAELMPEKLGWPNDGTAEPNDIKAAYNAGALHEAERAQPIIKLLEQMVERFQGAAESADQDIDTDLIKRCKKELAKYKEVSNER